MIDDWKELLSENYILIGVLIFVAIVVIGLMLFRVINAYTDWLPLSNIHAGLFYGK